MESFYDNGGIIGKKMNYSSASSATFSVVGTPTQTGTSASSITLPSGLQQGDIVFLCMVSDATLLENSVDTWTLLGYSDNNLPSHSIFYKIMGPTPDTSVTGLTNTSSQGCYFSFALRGISTTSPIINYTAFNRTVNEAPNPPNVDTTTASTDPYYGLFIVFLDDDVVSMTSPSGWTDITSGTIGSGGTGASFLAAYRELPITQTSVNPAPVTTSGSDTYWAYTIGLNMGSGGTTYSSGIWNLNAAAAG